MDEQLIRLFEDNPDSFLSGEELSIQMGCSRTAIWKHIERLRQQGYVFEAISRKGYRLIGKPEKLDIPLILSELQTETFGRVIHYLDEVDSTNTWAHQLVKQGAAEGTLVIAEQQTAGRGRMGRPWHSPKGKGLWMSLILKPRIPLQFTPHLTLLVAVALCRTIRQLTSLPAGIKWPNDLLIDGRKISGILLESSADDQQLQYVIAGVGIGVNLDADDYPDELKGIATSLAIESGGKVERRLLLEHFMLELETLYQVYLQQGFAPIKLLWEALSVSLNKQVRTNTPQGFKTGYALGIDESGALIVRQEDGTTTKWFSGTIEFGAATS